MIQFSTGIFSISLDFELHWGVSETRTVESYKENLVNTPEAIARMLDLFAKYEIHCTWATVGMLWAKNKLDLQTTISSYDGPTYKRPHLSNYELLSEIGESHLDDPFHFALPLVKQIHACDHQEIGTHTFSHYYCLESGPTLEDFKKDLTLSLHLAEREGIPISTIIFPRNQYNQEHLKVCRNHGITAYRGTEAHWIYRPRSREHETYLRKGCRLLDAYLPFSGTHIYPTLNETECKGLLNIPSSRFLRPFSPRFQTMDSLRMNRIQIEMTKAAKNRSLYHLWWHPHNFGSFLSQNLAFLEQILQHFTVLKDKWGMQSLNMAEITTYEKA
ncbi:MAG: polysaccharide deacetylase family protein [Bacteroidota bacterium]